MGKRADWMIQTELFSYPDFDHIICKMVLEGLGLSSPEVGLVSYDEASREWQIHLRAVEDVPLAALLEVIKVATERLKDEGRGDENTEGDFGRSHIEACSGEAIRSAGFRDADHFVSYVMDHYDRFYACSERKTAYLVVLPPAGDMMVVKLEMKDDHYTVLDAFFADRFYLRDLDRMATLRTPDPVQKA